MSTNRRKFTGLLVAALIFPYRFLAAWPKNAFRATSSKDALIALGPHGKKPVESNRVILNAPQIAENGALVPISVTTDLEGVKRISVLVANNPNPLAADFELSPVSIPEIKVKVKLGESSPVTAAVETKEKLYTKSQEVKVTLGGCGG